MVTNGVAESCYSEVLALTEGSINVLFQINELFEMSGDSLPTDSEIWTNMQHSITSGGIGNYAVNESSLMISE